MLRWARPHCEPFRRLMCHPRLAPFLAELCGEGFRLDHAPLCFIQAKKGAEGFDLHGGAVAASGGWLKDLAYDYRHGTMLCRLLAMSLQLTETCEGDGGFVILPGSHKSNLPVPPAVQRLDSPEYHRLLHQPVMRAGDVLLFSEACTHGALPWQSDTPRRVALYRFAPATSAYGRAYLDVAGDGRFLEELTEAQRAVLLPPFHPRLDRPSLACPGEEADGTGHVGGKRARDDDENDGREPEVLVKFPRSDVKKAFDQQVFGTRYF